MGSILENYDLLSRLLLQALINSLWQGALIVACAALLLRAAGRVSATTRHAIWLVSLLTIAVLPFLPASTQRFTATIPPAKPSTSQRIASSEQSWSAALAKIAALTGDERQAGVSARETSAAASVAGPEAVVDAVAAAKPLAVAANHIQEPNALQLWLSGRAPMVIVTLWLVISVLMLSRIVSSYLCLARLRCKLHRMPDFQRHRMSRLATIFGLKRRVRLRTSTGVAMPLTIGVARPLIVVPEGLIANLSDSEFESIVAHELAHIKRCDYMTNLWQRLIQAFLFFHPAVWFIGKQLAVERELACDDWAVKLTGEPHRYASCLTRLTELLRERRMPTLAAGIIFGKHVVSRRIEMILNTNHNATTSVSKPALLYAMGVAVLFVSVYSFLSPVFAVPLAQDQAVVARRQEPPAPVPATIEIPKIFIVNGQRVVRPAQTPLQLTTAVIQERPPILILDEDDIEPVTVVAAVDEPLDEMDVVPVPMQALYLNQSPAPKLTPATWQQPTTPPPPGAPRTVSGGTRTETPTIPEAELIAVLTDIIKRDADPGVRSEAMQGLYRLRTDGSINALLQLYDTMTDVKVKSEILGSVMRRNGDNSKAIAKLVSIAKTEKDDTLRGKALSALLGVKGDDGANNLIGIYDSLQEPKMKQSVIRALAMNKSKKAIDKLILIAKNDTDPTVRQYAVRSLISIDEGLYMQLLDKARTGISNFKEMRYEELDEQTKQKVKQALETHPEYHLVAPTAFTTPMPNGIVRLPQAPAAPVPTTPAPKRR